MKMYRIVLLLFLLIPFCSSLNATEQIKEDIKSSSQNPPKTKVRKYLAEIPAQIRQSPDPDSKIIGKIKEGTRLEAIAKDRHWIKVNVKGVEGWVTTAILTRVMDVPAPDLEFHSNGYKIIEGKYRHFFGINNTGIESYKGELTLKLFDNKGVIFHETYTFSEIPLVASGGRAFFVDLGSKAIGFEFETDTEKFSDTIGPFLNN